eukprot:766711-Hanusia_phi.AAC.1
MSLAVSVSAESLALLMPQHPILGSSHPSLFPTPQSELASRSQPLPSPRVEKLSDPIRSAPPALIPVRVSEASKACPLTVAGLRITDQALREPFAAVTVAERRPMKFVTVNKSAEEKTNRRENKQGIHFDD